MTNNVFKVLFLGFCSLQHINVLGLVGYHLIMCHIIHIKDLDVTRSKRTTSMF